MLSNGPPRALRTEPEEIEHAHRAVGPGVLMIGNLTPQRVGRDPGITVVVPCGLLCGCGNSAEEKRHDKTLMPAPLPMLVGREEAEMIPSGKRASYFVEPTPDGSDANLPKCFHNAKP